MNIFLDTSSLFKLYHKEPGSDIIDQVLRTNQIQTVFLSEIAKVEFTSTVWKKVRTEDISESQAKAKIALFENDFDKYTFIKIHNIITEQARALITKYGRSGLRTLDSIQLSTAVSLFNQCNLFIAADKLLTIFFEKESLPTK